MEINTPDKNSPAYESKAYTCQLPEMKICRDIEGGTYHIRQLGQLYLPQENAEERSDYAIKLARAIVHPGFTQTKAGLVGLVFKNELKLEEDVPVLIRGVKKSAETPEAQEGWAENIDNAGTHINIFAKEVFDKAMRDGHSFILVDMPPPLPQGATRQDEAGRRPYWTIREKSQAINWRTEVINGVLRLAQITFKEVSVEADGNFGEKEVTRYRVLRPGEWEIWIDKKEGEKNTTVLDTLADGQPAKGVTSLNEIPVAVVYANKTGVLQSRPLLIELAHIVINHYQKEADYSIYLHLTSRPLWFVRGGDPEKRFQIGPYAVQYLHEQNAIVGVAETSGAALGATRLDLKDLEERMALFGMSLLISKSSQRTATEAIQDDVAEKSPLQTAADSLKDGLEQALSFTAKFANASAKSGGSVNMGKLETLTLTPEMARVIFDAMGSKLSYQTGLKWLQTGKLPEDFDPQTEADAINAQAKEAAANALNAFNQGAV